MMEVQKYLKEFGIEKLKEEFKIVVSDYPNVCVLNYNQIESPRFHPVVDECRGLILRKSYWKVMARSFSRFYNFSEGVKQGKDVLEDTQRIASFSDYETIKIDISKAIFEEKLDGSICSLWFDDINWQVATRKMAFGEGQTNLGRTFSQVFFEALGKTKVLESIADMRGEYTIVFELIGPENRVVTRYDKNEVVLIGIRHNATGMEVLAKNLDEFALKWNCKRPNYYGVKNYEQLFSLVKALPTLNEGFVVKFESDNAEVPHFRIKVKNPSYLAIAHLRNNGAISPRRILGLVMTGEHEEYLTYFDSDKPYFDFVQEEYNKISDRIFDIYERAREIKDQKEFALTILPKVVYSFESGIVFQMRKSKDSLNQILLKLGAEKIAKGMNLKKMFVDKFHVNVEEEEEGAK